MALLVNDMAALDAMFTADNDVEPSDVIKILGHTKYCYCATLMTRSYTMQDVVLGPGGHVNMKTRAFRMSRKIFAQFMPKTMITAPLRSLWFVF